MKTNYKISIPKPCHEDWNQMTPDENGRFCNSCVKRVVDFTNMKTREIQEYFIKNQGKGICGRFKTEQLDSIIIQIPRDVLFSQVQFHKMFLLALLLTMGTTLFSCQNKDGDKQKIDGVEVVDSVNRTPAISDSIINNYKSPLLALDTLKYTKSFTTLTGFTITELEIDSLTGDIDVKENDSTKTEKN